MTKSLLALTNCTASLALLLLASPVLAEPPKVLPLEHEGQPGFWFPDTIARAALADIEELRVRRAELDLCRRQVEVKAERIKVLDKALTAARESAALSQSVIDEAVRGREQAERERSGWLAGQPWLWGGVGVVVGVVATGLVIHYAR